MTLSILKFSALIIILFYIFIVVCPVYIKFVGYWKWLA
jgi:hypothetical protein